MSDANRMLLSFVEEVAFGVFPSANLQDIRFVSESLKQETETITSAEVRSDRQIEDIVRANLNAAGDLSLELSFNTYDSFMEAALLSGDFSSAVTKSNVTFDMDDGDNSINNTVGDFDADGYLPNQWIKVSGFATDANNGLFKIVSVAALKMVLSHGVVVTEALGPSVTVLMGSQIVNGVEFRSFSLEKHYQDQSSEFAQFTGMTIDQFTLSITPGSIITGGFTFLGKKEVSASASAGSGNTVATTTDVMNAIDDVKDIVENKVALQSTALDLTLVNNLRQRAVIGVLGPISIGTGTVGVTGTLTKFFETKALMNKYLNFITSSLAFVSEDADGNSLVVDLPQIKFTDGQRINGGINTDILAEMSYTAFRHPVEGITIRIVKFPAP